MAKVICEEECPACGEMVQIKDFGFTYCSCGGAKVELVANWKIIEEKEND